MPKNSVLFLTLICAGIGGTLYYLGNIFYLPWTYWWYDIILHFLVSFTGSLGIFWGMFDSGIVFRNRFANRGLMIAMVFVCVMAVGIGWEIFEYANGLLDNTEGYALDTFNDLVFDSTGAFLAAVLVTRKRYG